MATPSVASFTLRDDNGVKASALFYISYNGALETVDGLIGNWLALGDALDSVTGAVILDGHIKIPLEADAGWKSAAINGDGVEQTLGLTIGNADVIYPDTFSVPALRETLVDSDGKPILAGAITTLATLLTTAFTNGWWVNDAGYHLTSFEAVFQATRKHRRQLKSRSTRNV